MSRSRYQFPGRHHVVYGGQFGSEGKGCVAEWLIRNRASEHLAKPVIVIGENGPNSGHTNTLGKTRSIPVSSYLADVVFIGPDAVIDPVILLADLMAVRQVRPDIRVFVHAHAGLITSDNTLAEQYLVGSIGSTATGGGACRADKYVRRSAHAVVGSIGGWNGKGIQILDNDEYLSRVESYSSGFMLFECSQGFMLDTNFGYYPYCTSRSTSPRVAIERNGLGGFPWTYHSTCRCHPIRTGGNSGPTGGREMSWTELGANPEQATVTKRTRRIFEFSKRDYEIMRVITRPDAIWFTHFDYIDSSQTSFGVWLQSELRYDESLPVHYSSQPSIFHYNG